MVRECKPRHKGQTKPQSTRQEKKQFLELAREVEAAGPTLGAVNTLAPSIWKRIALVVLKAIEEYCDAHLADKPEEEEIEAASLWLWIAVAAIAHPPLKHAKTGADEGVGETAIKPTEDGPFSSIVRSRTEGRSGQGPTATHARMGRVARSQAGQGSTGVRREE